ncbi:MAG: hypothetical protein U0520_04720 [Candidatus Saccharimonadales bacterium]
MKVKQYTIRNIPEPVDRYLRKCAKQRGQSLNQVVIEELSQRAGVGEKSLLESLDWFIGSGIDDGTIEALEEDDRAQKELTRKQWQEDDSRH